MFLMDTRCDGLEPLRFPAAPTLFRVGVFVNRKLMQSHTGARIKRISALMPGADPESGRRRGAA